MATRTISLRLMSGPQDGLQILLQLPSLGGKTEWTIGRSEECDIVLAYDPQASRRHARLICLSTDETVADGAVASSGVTLRFLLADDGSRNGTLINDRRLRNESAELKPGELFRIGRTWLRIDP